MTGNIFVEHNHLSETEMSAEQYDQYGGPSSLRPPMLSSPLLKLKTQQTLHSNTICPVILMWTILLTIVPLFPETLDSTHNTLAQ